MTNQTPQHPQQNPENPGNTQPEGARNLGGRPVTSPEQRSEELRRMMQDAKPEGGGTEHFDNPPTGADRAYAKSLADSIEQDARFGGSGGQDARSVLEGTVQDAPDPKVKKKRKQSAGQILARSPHQEEYRRLMKAGWTSFALERYADYRYGEKVASSTFRNYKARMLARDPKWLEATYLTDKDGKELIANGVEVDLDVMGVRQQMVYLQLHRISVDVQSEIADGKLRKDTWREFQLVMEMLDKVKDDQIAYGILPAQTKVSQFTVGDLSAEANVPRHSTLGGALGLPAGMSATDMASVVRELSAVVPITKNQGRTA